MIGAWFASEEGRAEEWHRLAWRRMAWIARYGHVTPNESAQWEASDLSAFARALDDILQRENKKPT